MVSLWKNILVGQQIPTHVLLRNVLGKCVYYMYCSDYILHILLYIIYTIDIEYLYFKLSRNIILQFEIILLDRQNMDSHKL